MKPVFAHGVVDEGVALFEMRLYDEIVALTSFYHGLEAKPTWASIQYRLNQFMLEALASDRPAPPPITRPVQSFDVASSNSDYKHSIPPSETNIVSNLPETGKSETLHSSELTVAPESAPSIPTSHLIETVNQNTLSEAVASPYKETLPSGHSENAMPKPLEVVPPVPPLAEGIAKCDGDTVAEATHQDTDLAPEHIPLLLTGTGVDDGPIVGWDACLGVSGGISTTSIDDEIQETSIRNKADAPLIESTMEEPAHVAERMPREEPILNEASSSEVTNPQPEDSNLPSQSPAHHSSPLSPAVRRLSTEADIVVDKQISCTTSTPISPTTYLSDANTITSNELITKQRDSITSQPTIVIPSIVETSCGYLPSVADCSLSVQPELHVWTDCPQPPLSRSALPIIPLGSVCYPTSNVRGEISDAEDQIVGVAEYEDTALQSCTLISGIWDRNAERPSQHVTLSSSSPIYEPINTGALEDVIMELPYLDEEESLADGEEGHQYALSELLTLEDFVHVDMLDDEVLIDGYVHPEESCVPQWTDSTGYSYGVRHIGKFQV